MHHDANLIATIAMGFVLAFALGFVAVKLRLPPLVGYLVAGIMAGPYTPGFVADADLAGQLAEMGVILLMFGVGLHFSTSALLAVRGIAIPGAVGQILIATLIGVAMTQVWGWSLGGGIVLGLSLSVASTVVLLKALEERNLVDTPNGRVAVGWLIVEDLAMVLALVLLPAFAESLGGHALGDGHAPDGPVWLTLLITLGKVALFTALAMTAGPRVVPWLLTRVARTGSRELFTLSVLAIAVGIAYGSSEIFGVSFALGAFFAGVVLAESRFSHRAAEESLPLQDAFSVLFFVSVGMLFDPTIIVREPLHVLAVLALIVIGKGIIAYLIVLALRYPASTGITIAGSLAQIGEFSFILAGLGIMLGLMPTEGRDLILAGALLSIVLNPVVFSAVGWANRKWFAKPVYGRANYDALEGRLDAIRRRNEDREKAAELRLHALIETFPLLALVDAREQEELLLMFRPKAAQPGERIVRRGDRGDSMFFISSGDVEVKIGDSRIKLHAGNFFGEMALLTGERRNADVTAVDYTQLLVLARADFNQFMSRHPALRSAVAAQAEERAEMNRHSHDTPPEGTAPAAT